MHKVKGTSIVAGFIHTPPSNLAKVTNVTAAWTVMLKTLVKQPPGPPPPMPTPGISTPPSY